MRELLLTALALLAIGAAAGWKISAPHYYEQGRADALRDWHLRAPQRGSAPKRER